MQGWIKLHRQITENEFWFSERFTKSQAWIDLLVLASHGGNTFFIRGNEIKLERGQIGYAIKTLSERWKWNERTVDKFLSALQKREMIQYRKTALTTIITIQNYNLYQGNTEQNTEQTQNRIHTIKNDKNEKNELTIKEAFESLKKNGIEEKEVIFSAKSKRFLTDYGIDVFKEGFTDAVKSWIEGNKNGEGFSRYFAVVLKNNYSKVTE